uniref:KRAB domain-containing protein n=1 Tax=Pelusios castaneus TaxID=367368 RepID=A0A8C8RBJ6_9SAUR
LKEVAAYVTKEECAFLAPDQTHLYKDIMQETYENLTSLGIQNFCPARCPDSKQGTQLGPSPLHPARWKKKLSKGACRFYFSPPEGAPPLPFCCGGAPSADEM